MHDQPTRRQWLSGTGATAAAAMLGACSTPSTIAADQADPKSLRRAKGSTSPARADRFAYCLNTGTIRGQKLNLAQQVDVAIEAGYDGVEPWIPDIQAYRESGGSLADIAKRCADAGLKIPSAIGFAPWIVEDDAARAAGLEQARRDMDLLRQIGGTRIAAPAAGATEGPKLDLSAVAERYYALLEVGREVGVLPQVEVWGFSVNLTRLSEAAFVAIEAGHPDACVLTDAYHMYKGGSDPQGLKLLGPNSMHVFHINDYPQIPRQQINDSDRVYPGDGDAPLDLILNLLPIPASHPLMLSLELFNRDYWKQSALEVAKTGLAKSRAAVRKARG